MFEVFPTWSKGTFFPVTLILEDTENLFSLYKLFIHIIPKWIISNI